MADIIEQFMAALSAGGIELANGERITPDGRLHRVRLTTDRAGQRTGWYRLHLDAPPAGAGGDWRTGARVNWCGKRLQSFTTAERETLRQRIEQDRAQARAETARRHREAAARAVWIWEHAKPASASHPYLVRKGIAPGIARQSRGALVLPVVGLEGALHGLQFIQPDGSKRFISGMAKAGHFIPSGGKPDGARPVWVAEGWGTACALQVMRPQVCCIAGLDAGNLQSVATEARKRWPTQDIVVCPDFDSAGRQKGQEAAEKARARILPPPARIPEGATDWLDVLNARRQGVKHV